MPPAQARRACLKTLAEVQASLDYPPSEPIPWQVTAGKKRATVRAQFFYEARRLGSLALRVLPWQVTCVPVVEKPERLSGSGRA